MDQTIIQSNAGSKTAMSEETGAPDCMFYCDDDMSRTAPGKKDYVKIWEEAGKVREEQQHMHYIVKEMYAEVYWRLEVARER